MNNVFATASLPAFRSASPGYWSPANHSITHTYLFNHGDQSPGHLSRWFHLLCTLHVLPAHFTQSQGLLLAPLRLDSFYSQPFWLRQSPLCTCVYLLCLLFLLSAMTVPTLYLCVFTVFIIFYWALRQASLCTCVYLLCLLFFTERYCVYYFYWQAPLCTCVYLLCLLFFTERYDRPRSVLVCIYCVYYFYWALCRSDNHCLLDWLNSYLHYKQNLCTCILSLLCVTVLQLITIIIIIIIISNIILSFRSTIIIRLKIL